MKVVYIVAGLAQYRVPFHQAVRHQLAKEGVEYELWVTPAKSSERGKGDSGYLDWARPFLDLRIKGTSFIYQCVYNCARKVDLVILVQENSYLLNYILQMFPGKTKIAFFGHGRNFQSRNPDGRGERWKRFWATKVNWWFAYTEETRRHVESIGFPSERITVFNNSVDTSALRAQVAAITPERLESLRAELCITGKHVGVFVGGIYPDKRMPFLVEAGELIRQRIPDFEMIVVGGGSDLPVIQELARSRPWIHVTGPRFGEEKVALMLLGQVFLMPGLMGLAILDAGVAGLPIATTGYPWHSPEIAYLLPGENGVIVQDWQSAQDYAEAVAGILNDPTRQKAMSEASRAMADRYSIEAMAANFAAGVLAALKSQ